MVALDSFVYRKFIDTFVNTIVNIRYQKTYRSYFAITLGVVTIAHILNIHIKFTTGCYNLSRNKQRDKLD